MARYNDNAGTVDADIEVGLLMQMRGMSRQQAIAEMLRRREAEAQLALARANEIAQRGQEARKIRDKTGVRSPDADPQGVVRMEAPKPMGRAGAFGETQAHAESYQYPLELGQREMRDTPGSVEHEARLWQGGLRGVAPDEEAEEESRIRRNLNRMRTI